MCSLIVVCSSLSNVFSTSVLYYSLLRHCQDLLTQLYHRTTSPRNLDVAQKPQKTWSNAAERAPTGESTPRPLRLRTSPQGASTLRRRGTQRPPQLQATCAHKPHERRRQVIDKCTCPRLSPPQRNSRTSPPSRSLRLIRWRLKLSMRQHPPIASNRQNQHRNTQITQNGKGARQNQVTGRSKLCGAVVRDNI